MSKRPLPENHLIKDHSAAPDVNFGVNLGIVLETLRREVPVGPGALGGQVHFGLIFRHNLTEPKVRELHNPV